MKWGRRGGREYSQVITSTYFTMVHNTYQHLLNNDCVPVLVSLSTRWTFMWVFDVATGSHTGTHPENGTWLCWQVPFHRQGSQECQQHVQAAMDQLGHQWSGQCPWWHRPPWWGDCHQQWRCQHCQPPSWDMNTRVEFHYLPQLQCELSVPGNTGPSGNTTRTWCATNVDWEKEGSGQ